MQPADLNTLFRDLEAANLERSLRLLTRAFSADEAGLLCLRLDRLPSVYLRTLGPEANNPSIDELKGALIESPASELLTSRLHSDWRGIVISAIGGNRILFWLRKISVWTKDEEAYFQAICFHLSRSTELRERLTLNNESTRLDQRLSDAAQFSGRIAHDFDNILTGVTGFADLAIGLHSPDERMREFLQEIRTSGSRGLVFTQQLHHLSRSGIVKPVPSSAVDSLNKLKRSHPSICLVDMPSDLPEVALESSSLQLVLNYLIDNAVEASPKEGNVSVRCRLVELSPAESQEFLGSPAPGPHVEIAIVDAGAGIRDDIFPRLFHEPFVTTKPRHRGLGLPICYRILRVHRSGIRLDSQPGRGTTALVVVPLAAARQRNTPAAIREVAHSSGG